MGSISFLLPNPLPAAAAASLRDACFAGGYDQTPVPTKTQISDGKLIVTRSTDESGYLLVPWPVEPFGVIVTTTSTLRERAEPYALLVELARGKLNQVRTQTADWQALGLRTPPDYDRSLTVISKQFGSAVLSRPSPGSDRISSQVLEQSYALADRLVRMYVDQVFATRRHDEGRLPTRFAARLPRAPGGELLDEYKRAFNALQLSVHWRDVEPAESEYDWTATDQLVRLAKEAGLPLTVGPVIDLSPGMLPAWAAGWKGDLPTLAAFMCDFLETMVARYKSDVRRWVVCGGFNHADGLDLADDDRLRLASRLFESATHVDPDLELVLSVAQPWGDYLVDGDQTISPLAFAEDLVRTGLKVSAVELELRIGSQSRGSMPRDQLDTSRLLDLFGLLGLPIEVVLCYPSSGRPDPRAAVHQQALWANGWRTGPSPEGQAEWGTSFAGLALCKPHVRAVTWDHWYDDDPHLSPAGGLIDATGKVKPLLPRLRALRTSHLK